MSEFRFEQATIDAGSDELEMASQFTKQVLKMANDAHGVTIFRELDDTKQMEVFVNGVMIGVMSYVLICARNSSVVDMVERYLHACIATARHNAELINGKLPGKRQGP